MMLLQRFFVVALIQSLPRAASAFSVAPKLAAHPQTVPHRGIAHSGQQRCRSSYLFMATWSDSKAVKEYQDFLASGKQKLDMASDGPSVIIKPHQGSSELADALASMGMGNDLILTPDQELPDRMGDADEYPVYVTLPPTQLVDFLANLKDSYRARPESFVFFSGGLKYGNIEDVLKVRGYCRDSMTQVLISGLGITPYGCVEDMSVRLATESANGESKWAGECAACGKFAGAVAERLERNNVRCKTDFYREWRRRMWERSTYDAVFHLVGSVRSELTTIAQVANYYSEEVGDMVWEMSQLLRGWKALTLTYGFEERMFGVAESVGRDQPSTLIPEMYPFIWGNQVFLQSKMFVEYLRYAAVEGVLQGVELPQTGSDDFQSNMRQGNLRADGVI